MNEYALSEIDHGAIDELSRRAVDTGANGLVSWFSLDRKILWMRLFVTGSPGPWMMVPAADQVAAARQREVFCQLVGIQLEINRLLEKGAVAH